MTMSGNLLVRDATMALPLLISDPWPRCGLVKRQLLPDVCTCTCPKPSSSRRSLRRLFGMSVTQKCPPGDLGTRLALIQSKCCPSGHCPGKALPTKCSFECSQVFPAFYRDCASAVLAYDASNAEAYKILDQTCASLSAGPMILAIASAQASSSNPQCNPTKFPTRAPTVKPTLVPTSTPSGNPYSNTGYSQDSHLRTAWGVPSDVDCLEKMTSSGEVSVQPENSPCLAKYFHNQSSMPVCPSYDFRSKLEPPHPRSKYPSRQSFPIALYFQFAYDWDCTARPQQLFCHTAHRHQAVITITWGGTARLRGTSPFATSDFRASPIATSDFSMYDAHDKHGEPCPSFRGTRTAGWPYDIYACSRDRDRLAQLSGLVQNGGRSRRMQEDAQRHESNM